MRGGGVWTTGHPSCTGRLQLVGFDDLKYIIAHLNLGPAFKSQFTDISVNSIQSSSDFEEALHLLTVFCDAELAHHR